MQIQTDFQCRLFFRQIARHLAAAMHLDKIGRTGGFDQFQIGRGKAEIMAAQPAVFGQKFGKTFRHGRVLYRRAQNAILFCRPACLNQIADNAGNGASV